MGVLSGSRGGGALSGALMGLSQTGNQIAMQMLEDRRAEREAAARMRLEEFKQQNALELEEVRQKGQTERTKMSTKASTSTKGPTTKKIKKKVGEELDGTPIYQDVMIELNEDGTWSESVITPNKSQMRTMAEKVKRFRSGGMTDEEILAITPGVPHQLLKDHPYQKPTTVKKKGVAVEPTLPEKTTKNPMTQKQRKEARGRNRGQSNVKGGNKQSEFRWQKSANARGRNQGRTNKAT